MEGIEFLFFLAGKAYPGTDLPRRYGSSASSRQKHERKRAGQDGCSKAEETGQGQAEEKISLEAFNCSRLMG
jgi:hypothetical protein